MEYMWDFLARLQSLIPRQPIKQVSLTGGMFRMRLVAESLGKAGFKVMCDPI